MIRISLIAILSLLLFNACEQENKDFNKEGNLTNEIETINQGEVTVHIDQSLYPIMDSIFKMYREDYPDVNLNDSSVTSRQAMSLLLSGNSRVIITARDYLKDEDSLMTEYEVPGHLKMKIAQDALTFFTSPQFPLDTLSDEQIKDVLINNAKLSDYFDELVTEPIFVTVDQYSSEYANIYQLILKDNKLQKPLKIFSTIDSVKNYVRNNKNAIGIGFLGNVVNEPDFKELMIGFTKENGTREYPQVVHQAYIVMERYPYIVDYYAYLLEERRNMPFWFASYIAKENKIQKYLNDYGVVPAFAKIRLIKE